MCLKDPTILHTLLLNVIVLHAIALTPNTKKHLNFQGKHALAHINKKFKLSMRIKHIHGVDYFKSSIFSLEL